MFNKKQRILESLAHMRGENMKSIAALSGGASLAEYEPLAQEENGMRIWTHALQAALDAHEIVYIPAADTPYYIDQPVLIPSNRHIEAEEGAVIRLIPGAKLLMLRNENAMDGTHAPIPKGSPSENISINGGRWEESCEGRAGYGKSGMFDAERSLYGVTTMLYFGNIEGLTLTNMTFARAAGFCVQLGDAKNVVIENIVFERCFADGIHLNGNTENVIISRVSGNVGDDLVALNTYDWLNSSVNFGPGKNMLIEHVEAPDSGRYKSMRLEQGIYTYDDGTQVDCSLTDAIIRRVKGIRTFKMYFQTPSYVVGTEPEKGMPGSMDGIFFEEIDIDLCSPLDLFSEYVNSDPVRGWFGAFEIGSNIGSVFFDNIRLTLYAELYPMSRLIVVGPKSARRAEREVFDPGISNTVENIFLKNVYVNGELAQDADKLIHITSFEDVNGDGRSTGKGAVGKIQIEQRAFRSE